MLLFHKLEEIAGEALKAWITALDTGWMTGTQFNDF